MTSWPTYAVFFTFTTGTKPALTAPISPAANNAPCEEKSQGFSRIRGPWKSESTDLEMDFLAELSGILNQIPKLLYLFRGEVRCGKKRRD